MRKQNSYFCFNSDETEKSLLSSFLWKNWLRYGWFSAEKVD